MGRASLRHENLPPLEEGQVMGTFFLGAGRQGGEKGPEIKFNSNMSKSHNVRKGAQEKKYCGRSPGFGDYKKYLLLRNSKEKAKSCGARRRSGRGSKPWIRNGRG